MSSTLGHPSINMNLNNSELLGNLCCLYNAYGNVKTVNLTGEKYFSLAALCFTSNTTARQDIATIIEIYNEYINDTICLPLRSNVLNICDIPTSKGNIIYSVFLFLLMFFILATNGFYCLAMFYSRNLLRHPSHRFILSLAVSDLLVALVAMPIIIDFTLHNQAFCSSIFFCHLAYFADHLVFISLILTLLAIGVDRFLAVAKPYQYHQLMSPLKSKIIIVSIWIISCLFGVTANVDWGNLTLQGVEINKRQVCFTSNPKVTGAILVTCFFAPVTIMGFLYYRIFRETLMHAVPIATIGSLGDPGHVEEEDPDHVEEEDPDHVEEEDPDRIKEEKPTREAGPVALSRMRIAFMRRSHDKRPRQQYVSCFSCAKLRVLRAVVIVYGTFVVCWLPGMVITALNLFSPGLVILKVWQFYLLNLILPLSSSAINVFIYAVMNKDCRKAMLKLLTCSLVQRHVERKRNEREKMRRRAEASAALELRPITA